MDREAKLAAAKKKLRQFKKKKGLNKSPKSAENSETSSTTSDRPTPTSTPTQNHADDILEIEKSEKFIDEKFELLRNANSDNLSESTAATTESILQVSAKLNGIAAEAAMFIDDASSNHSSEEKFQIIDHPKPEEPEQQNVISALEVRNQELASKLASFSQDNEVLRGHCHNLSDQVQLMQKQLEAKTESENRQFEDENVFQEKLQVQMQTISVLVSEKQDLHQELLMLRSELHNRNIQHEKNVEEMQTMREKLASCVRDLQSKTDEYHHLERNNIHLQSQNSDYNQELIQTKQILENEKMQSTELMGKLQTKVVEFNELYRTHVDLKERFEMADVLLQQMSANNNADAASQLRNIQQENETLKTRCLDYQQAFEQMNAEREQLDTQYNDTRKKWENDLQNLQQKISLLENEKQDLYQQCMNLHESLKTLNEKQNEEKNETLDNTENNIDNINDAVNEEKQKAATIQNNLREEITAQQNTNQYLSHLVQEKETRIYELENELDQVKSSINEHEQLLDNARSDKVAISRALLQNKQLKEQLEEIQDGFVRMSNDKMDLATNVISLEHVNKDLQLKYDQSEELQEQLRQELQRYQLGMHRLQEQNSHLQSHLNAAQSSHQNGVAQPPENSQIEALQHMIAQLQNENQNLQEKLNSVIVINQTESNPEIEHASTSTDIINDASLDRITENDSTKIPEPENETMATDEDMHTEHNTVSHVQNHFTYQIENNGVQLDAMAILQEKFTAVMKEKADLLNRLELMEHANTQLQNECDTIGEYIALYHNQRQILKQRHKEKDKYISNIIQEREAMQGKVEQLQTLIVAVLNNRQNGDVDFSASPPRLDESYTTIESENQQIIDPKSSLMQEQPDLVPKSDISRDNDLTTPTRSPVPGHLDKVRTTSESSDNATTTQILTLLEQMQKPIDPGVLSKTSIPSGFCMHYIGPYTAI
uniref:golgin subfamily A member 2-like n=1 Tax=Styela clava TaxID=7725 RepID=UPI00193ACE1F|nr:golgin subfamily A member 2-like [Styela clava]